MKIALVHDFLTSYTGAERVLKVLADMYPDAPIYTLLYDEAKVGHVFPKERVRPSKLQQYPTWLRSRRRFLLGRMPIMVESFDLSAYDLVISSSGAWSKGVITKPETTHICYCHAPMRFAWDWHSEYLDEQGLTGLKRFAALWILNRIRQWDYLSSKRVDYWIANSKTTQKRLRKYYGVASEVIYPPIDIERFTLPVTRSQSPETDNPCVTRYPLPVTDFYLIVSRLEPYKRIDLAVEAFRNMPDKKLIIIGDGSARSNLEKNASANISFLGFQNDDVVTAHYQSMKALIFPGEDDFGITPVEAFACGKPVIAFEKGGATETVLPGKTGIFFTEPTATSLESAIRTLESTIWHPEEIKSHAREFSTSTFEQKIRDCLDKATTLHS